MERSERPGRPSVEELAKADRLIEEFLAQVKAVPEAERQPLRSDKFLGPVGMTDDE